MIDQRNRIREKAWPTWPHYAEDEISAATHVLKSGKVNYWTGDEGRQFEKEYAAYVGTEYAVALMNGTVALEAALYALDIGPGDEVIAPSRTFIASASAIILHGAVPVLADVDENSQNITAATIEPLITPKTKAIITVHLAGWPCAMDEILALAKKHGLYVIEDCAQAHGAVYKGKQVGAWGDIAAFSFCQNKIISTGGEGGMVTTNHKHLWEKIWAFKDHGKSYDAMFNRIHPPGFRWVCESFGTNWRMTEMQAAIGRIQLRKLSQWIDIRERNAAILQHTFSKLPAIRTVRPPKDVKHAYYQFYFFLQPDRLKQDWSRDRILEEITLAGVPASGGSCSEIYLEKAFQTVGLNPKARLPMAKKLGETSLMCLVHPTLTEKDMHAISALISPIISEAS